MLLLFSRVHSFSLVLAPAASGYVNGCYGTISPHSLFTTVHVVHGTVTLLAAHFSARLRFTIYTGAGAGKDQFDSSFIICWRRHVLSLIRIAFRGPTRRANKESCL